MFSNTLLSNVNLSKWDMSKVKDMSNMFYNTSNFTGIGLNSWILQPNVTITNMFCFAISFNRSNIISWNVTNIDDAFCS